MTAGRPDPVTGSADAAVDSLGARLDALRAAMIAGDVPAIEEARARLQALLSDPAWRQDASRGTAPARLEAALRRIAVDAALAARGEAYSARALAALAPSPSPSLYTSSGALGARGGPSRAVSA